MPRKQRGRPTKYTPKVAKLICMGLAEGLSLRKVCKEDDMPDKATVFRWLREHENFRDQYTRAKEEGMEAWAEEIIDIADDGTNDYMADNYDKGKTPGYALNGENIQRSKLRVDTRKWVMSKLKPKKYGDKIDHTSDGEKIEFAPIYGGLSGGQSQNTSD